MEGDVGIRTTAPLADGRQDVRATYGNYRVLDSLGAGSSGVVFRAVDETSGERVAIKTLQLRDPSDLECLRREIHSLSRLRDDGIIRILGHGLTDGVPWYAMELIEGCTMETLWATNGIGFSTRPFDSMRPALRAIRRICDTLAFMHNEGIVHRDLKPANIVLRDHDVPVIVDFGFASRFGARIGREILEVSGEMVGTLAYMAPEQVRGELVDARADLYSIGCILYEAVTGRPPFVGAAWQVYDSHLRAVPEAPSVHARTVPPDLDRLILSLLSKDPTDRIGYAVDVSARLGEVIDEPTGTVSTSARYLYRSRFVGRRSHMAKMESAIDRLAAGVGGVLFIGGESGVGKTRFAMETGRLAKLRGLPVIAGQCISLESSLETSQIQGGPLHPFVPLLRYIADWCRPRGEEASVRLLGRRAKTLGAYEPSLSDLPGIEQFSEPAPLPAADARGRLVSDLGETLRLFAREAGFVLLIDDLQWADELTLHCLEALLETLFEDGPILLIGCYRTEEVGAKLATIVAPDRSDDILLERLNPADLGALASDMLAIQNPAESLTRFISTHTEGNPFFVSEYLRLLVEERLLVRSGEGRWQTSAVSGDSWEVLPIPPTIHSLIARRLDGISADARVLLEAAAVIGREFEWALVSDCVELTDARKREGIGELLARHVLEETGGDGLRFSHDKLREVAYGLLSAASRRELHRRVADTIQRLYTGAHLSALFPSLALHWSNAGEHGRAAEYYSRAAEIALRSGASGDSLNYFGRALASDDVSHLKVTKLQRGHWIRQMGDASYGIGDISGTIRYALQAQEALGFPVPRGTFARVMSVLRHGRELFSAIARPGPITDEFAHEAALAAGQVSQVYYLRSQFVAGTASQLRSVALARRSGGLEMAAQSFAQLGYVCGTLGLSRIERHCFEQAHALRSDADPNVFGGVLYFECMAETGRAHWPAAIRAGEDAYRLLEGLGNRQEAETALCVLGNVHYNHGDFAESERLCRELLDSARTRGNRHHTAWGLFLSARAIAAQGRLDSALVSLEQAHRMLLEANDVLTLIMCEGTLVRALLATDDFERGREVRDVLEQRLRAMPVLPLAQCLDGVVGAADASLCLWKRSGGASDLRVFRRACRRLAVFARMHPFAAPSALRSRGLNEATRGRKHAALACWRRSLDQAEQLDMRHEQARAHALLWRYEDDADRTRHFDAACSLLDRLGCRRELDRLTNTERGDWE